MSKKQCPECGASNSPLAMRCSACNAHLSSAGSTKAKGEKPSQPHQQAQQPSKSSQNLVECSDCCAQISQKAPSCPHCGSPRDQEVSLQTSLKNTQQAAQMAKSEAAKKMSMTIGAFIWLSVIVGAGSAWLGSQEKPEDDRVEEVRAEPETKPKPKKVLTAEEQREKQIRRQFSAWDGSHHNLERLVKDSLHDPDSYDHVETRYSDKGDHLVVALKYRAVNGFGALRLHRAIAKVDMDGTVLQVIDNSPL